LAQTHVPFQLQHRVVKQYKHPKSTNTGVRWYTQDIMNKNKWCTSALHFFSSAEGLHCGQ